MATVLCELRVHGSCRGDSNFSARDWFDDTWPATTRQACRHRHTQWKRLCWPGVVDWAFRNLSALPRLNPTQTCETSTAALAEQHAKGRYNLTLVSIFKRERFALRNWVWHHLAEGVDHFLLVRKAVFI